MLLGDLIHRVLQAVAPGDDDAVAIGVTGRCRQLGSDTQQTCHGRDGDDPILMQVDAILETGIPRSVGTDQVVELER